MFFKNRRKTSLQEFARIFSQSYRLQAFNFIKRETLAQVLFYEYREIFTKTFPVENLKAAACDTLYLVVISIIRLKYF